MAMSTQGTELYFLDPEGSPDTVTKVGCPISITGLGGGREQINTTCLDSLEQTFLPGFANPGPIGVTIQFDADRSESRAAAGNLPGPAADAHLVGARALRRLRHPADLGRFLERLHAADDAELVPVRGLCGRLPASTSI